MQLDLPERESRRLLHPARQGGLVALRLQSGFLIAIKQRNGSTSFDKGSCCRSPDPVAAARDDSYFPIKAKTFKHLFSQISSTTQVRDMRSSRGTE
jgi:hypothetical protein